MSGITYNITINNYGTPKQPPVAPKSNNTRPQHNRKAKDVAIKALESQASAPKKAKTAPEREIKHIVYQNNPYIGQCLNGVPHGTGTMTWPGGEYTGNWVNGQKHGVGKSSDNLTDEHYVGEWTNDKFDGFGKLSSTEQQRVETGYWKNGLLHNEGERDTPDLNFKGGWKDGLYHGAGTYTKKNEDVVIKGVWKEGNRDGLAQCSTREYHVILEYDNGIVKRLIEMKEK